MIKGKEARRSEGICLKVKIHQSEGNPGTAPNDNTKNNHPTKKTLKPYNTSLTHMNTFASVTL